MHTMVRVASVSLILSALFACTANLAPTPLDFAIAPGAVNAQSAIQLSLTVPATDPDGDDDSITYAVTFAVAADASAETFEAVEAFNRSGLSADELDGYCWAPENYVSSEDLSCDDARTISDAGVQFVDGQVWEVTVEATDSSGLPSVWSPTYSFVVGNSAPVINSIYFQMTDSEFEEVLTFGDGETIEAGCPRCGSPHGLGNLEIVVDTLDVDDDELKYSVSWSCDSVVEVWEDSEDPLYEHCSALDGCDGVVIPEAEEDGSVDALPPVPEDQLRPCQVWTATGWVSDGFLDSNIWSASVLVGDYLPVASNVTLTADKDSGSEANIEEEVTCRWNYWDLEAEEGDGTGVQSKVTWSGCNVTSAAAAVAYDEGADEYYVTATPGELGCEKENVLACEVLPIDAEGFEGTAANSSSIAIVNAPPSVPFVTLSWVLGTVATVEEKLSCDPGAFFDADGDLEPSMPTDPNDLWHVYTWSAGSEYEGYTSLPAGDGFQKGDTVWCEFAPYDGIEYGEAVRSNEVVIFDSVPRITGDVIISGASSGDTNLEDELSCEYTFLDLDEDEEGASIVKWIDGDSNEITTSTGAAGVAVIQATEAFGFQIDDEVSCSVKPVDGVEFAEGKVIDSSNSVTIVNAAPVVEDVTIRAAGGGGVEDTLTCEATASDIDGDETELAWTFTWKDASNVEFASGYSVDLSEHFSSSNIAKGKDVKCVAEVTDDFGDTGKDSETHTVANTSPELSDPLIETTSGVGISAELTCSFTETDIDGDSVTVSHVWTRDEDSYDFSEAGAVLDLGAYSDIEEGDTIRCTGTPSDGDLSDGGLSTTYTVGNTPPEITAVTITCGNDPCVPGVREVLTCAPEATDVDGDSVTFTYSWYQNSDTVALDPDGSDLLLSTLLGVASGTDIHCKVTPNDGAEDGDIGEATVTVGNTPPTIGAVQVLNDDDSSPIISAWDSATCEVTSDDADGDSITTTYKWYVDGNDTGLTDGTIAVSDAVATYDMTLRCEATVSDADIGDTDSGEVVLVDAAPQWDSGGSATLRPALPVIGDTMVCEHGDAEDPDGTAVTYSYSWAAYTDGNGPLVQGYYLLVGESESTFSTHSSSSGLMAGDQIKCVVEAKSDTDNDGSWDSAVPPHSANQFLVANEAPQDDGQTVIPIIGDEIIVESDYFSAGGAPNVFPPEYGLSCMYSLCDTCDDTSPPVDPEGHELRTRLHWFRTPGDGSVGHIIGSWAALTVGPRHGCAYDSETHAVDCWGEDIDGSLDGWDQGGAGVSDSMVLKAGTDYTCAIDLTTDVSACWGASPGGVPEAWVHDVPTLGIIDVGPGVNHTCWVLVDGSLGCAGDDTYGQVSDVPATGGYIAVDSGSFHSCALHAGGEVTCWGIDDSSAEDDAQVRDMPSGTFTSIDAGNFHTCAVRSGGSIECWGLEQGAIGGNSSMTSAGPYASVWSGENHSCAITTGGEVACWSTETGDHVDAPFSDTQIGFRKDYYTDVVAVAPGYGTTCLLFEEGGSVCYADALRLHAEGASNSVAFQPEQTHLDPAYVTGDMVTCSLEVEDVYGRSATFSSEVLIAAAFSVSANVDFGSATCLEEGRSNVGCDYEIVDADWSAYTDTSHVEYTNFSLSGLPTFDWFDAGFEQVCAVEPSGELTCWGDMNSTPASGLVPTEYTDGTKTVAELSVAGDYVVVITDAGLIDLWGAASGTAAITEIRADDAQVVSGHGFSCSIRVNGALICASSSPISLVTTANTSTDFFQMIDAGFGNGPLAALCGITDSGSIVCFDNAATSGHIVTDVPVSSNWETVSVGSKLACAIDDGGLLECWGVAMVTLPTASGVRAVATTEGAVCFINTTDEITCQYGSSSQADEPPAGRYSALTAGTVGGGFYFCALATGGTVHCWGEPSTAIGAVYEAPGFGQLVDGDTLECTVTPCVDDGVEETCGAAVTVSIPVETTCP